VGEDTVDREIKHRIMTKIVSTATSNGNGILGKDDGDVRAAAATAAVDVQVQVPLFKVRTITAFITLQASDFEPVGYHNNSPYNDNNSEHTTRTTVTTKVELKIKHTVSALEKIREQLTSTASSSSSAASSSKAYEVQTIRIATNPFPEYLLPSTNSTSTSTSTSTNNKNKSVLNNVLEERLHLLDACLEHYGIQFFSLGCASSVEEVHYCTRILEFSTKFSCSVQLQANDTQVATAAADTILRNSKLQQIGCTSRKRSRIDDDTAAPPPADGLANFRFCVANVTPYIPFFPAAKAASAHSTDTTTDDTTASDDNTLFVVRFAIGFENGTLLKHLLMNDANQTIEQIVPPPRRPSGTTMDSNFAAGFTTAVRPIQTICQQVVSDWNNSNNASNNVSSNDTTTNDSTLVQLVYMGLDASMNPSLDKEGSIASAIEVLQEIPTNQFGGPGTVAAVAAMTTAIQTRLGNDDTDPIKLTGYNGLMLPLCEDTRLAQLATAHQLHIKDLLLLSSVCGVGIDTVPLPGNTSVTELSAFLLDVVGLAARWSKPLSCRVFPVPHKVAGDTTTFESPYLVNCKIVALS